MQKQTAINLVSNNISSIYTKEDVINLLEGIDDAGETSVSLSALSDEQVKSLVTSITDAICGHGDTQSLVSDYDLSMNYREVELDSISFDDGNIEDVVQYGINEWLENNTNK